MSLFPTTDSSTCILVTRSTSGSLWSCKHGEPVSRCSQGTCCTFWELLAGASGAAPRWRGRGANEREGWEQTAWEYSLSLSFCSGEAASPRRRKVCASPVCRTLYKRKKLSFVEEERASGGWEQFLVMIAVGCCLGGVRQVASWTGDGREWRGQHRPHQSHRWVAYLGSF